MRGQKRNGSSRIPSCYSARRVSVLIIAPLAGVILWLASRVYLVRELLTLFAFLTVFFAFGTCLLFIFLLFQEAVRWGARRILLHWRATLYAPRHATQEGAVVLIQNSKTSAALTGH